MLTKSRDLSILDFLEVLMEEYFIADLRSKIYNRKADRVYWKKIVGFKKEKIEDITERNSIKSIFYDKEMYLFKMDRYYPTNEICSLIKNNKDLRSYYNSGCDVTITTSTGDVITGRIEDADLMKGKVWVNLFDTNDSKEYKLHQVRRIL